MKNKFTKRILSAILCLAMVISTLPAIPLTVTAASAAGTEPAITTESFYRDGVTFDVTRSTQYMGNRTYKVQMELSSVLSTSDHARIRTASQNGYITIEQTGYYLIELWGGRGANGESGSVLLIPTPGGEGASGGYVYGKVFLKAGQTLAYNIGTNGTQSEMFNDGAGGVNGGGGTHGSTGSYTVGAGGGYTAIYLFEENEFKEEYVSARNFSIPEAARLSRYLMIAGGGGGGGAGVGSELVALIENNPDRVCFEPNGGAGGNVNRGISMSLLGSSYAVPGYVFSGRNGSSSGTSNTYIGRGGSNVPGVGSTTIGGDYTETSPANDWSGTYNSSTRPGAGGSGNLRGGGGGSGYAGGSGGLMTALTRGSNIGGGGGGSSFIADSVNGQKIEFLNLTDKEKEYLSGASQQPDGAGTGGAAQITYLQSETGDFYQEALDDITFTATFSRYFELKSYVLSNNEATLSTTTKTSGDYSTNITIKNLSVTPVSPNPNLAAKTSTITLYLKAKNEFLGGNYVDMFKDELYTFRSPNTNLETDKRTLDPENKEENRYVNVPLNMQIKARSYTTSDKNKTYKPTDLYVDDYTDMRSSITSYWECDYLAAIYEYEVLDKDGNSAPNSIKLSEEERVKSYIVKCEVLPKYQATEHPNVTVGPAMINYSSSNATVTLVDVGTGHLNNLLVTGTKDLSYDNGVYTFKNIIEQKSEPLPINGVTEIIGINDESDWEAPADGWYYVEAWGGNGGGTAAATIYNRYLSPAETYTASSASGGKGGYVSSYIHLNKGDVINTTIGTVGSSGGTGSNGGSYNSNSSSSKDTNVSAFSYGGSGGKATTVMFNGSTVMIAGGGGGAGGGAVLGRTAGKLFEFDRTQSKPAVTGKDSTTINSGTEPSSSSYNGSSGGKGNASWDGSRYFASRSTSAGSAGSASVSFKNTTFGTTQNGYTLSSAAQKYAQEKINTTKSGSNGQVAITLIENSDMLSTMETVKGISTKVAFSRYFNIGTINMSVGTTYNSRNIIVNDDGSKTVTYTHSTYGQIAKFTYDIEYTSDGLSIVNIYDCDYTLNGEYVNDGNGYKMNYTANLNFTYSLTPKEGFFGGNDVPVLAYGQTGGGVDQDNVSDYGIRISQGTDFMYLPAVDPTDFANVENNVDLTEYLSVQNKTIHKGESVEKSELYTFTPPTATEGWEDDFAQYISPGNDTYSPTETTEYIITASLKPNAPAAKATVVDSVEEQSYSLAATVYVELAVNKDLTNLIYEGDDWTLYKHDFSCMLVPEDGYLLPDEIKVTVGGTAIDNYDYNSSLGTVYIPAEYVTDTIEITAKAQLRTYEIHFVYTQMNPETGLEEFNERVYTDILADSVIDWSDLDSIVSSMPAKEGYKYAVQYDSEDGSRPQTMPANNLWVYGSYEKAEYLLTINYQYKDGSKAAEPYQEYVLFGDAYSVVSPAANKGYLADQPVVSGVMGAANVTVTVTYEPSVNILFVIYQRADGTIIDKVQYSMETDQQYSISVPDFEGYTTQTDVIEGKMQGDDSETVTVIYTPNNYTLTFNKNGKDEASLDYSTKLVEYDKNFAYNAQDKTYDGLPIAQITGYTFAGWFTEPECVNEVKESDIVKITSDTTLYAKWKTAEYKLTIHYDFLYANGDYIPEGFDSADAVQSHLVIYEQMVEYGADYSVILPSLVGYSAYENFGLNDQVKVETLSGTMPGQNVLIVISYEINTYTIQFIDNHQTVSYSDAETSTDGENDTTFDSGKTWETVKVKHNVAPVYSKTVPTHSTTANYTYVFNGWYGVDDQQTYGDGENVSPAFPVATKDSYYYAKYGATENIVSIGSDKHFSRVDYALDYADENALSSFTMTFRRNNGNGTTVNLNNDTLILNGAYSGTVTIDLNAKTLMNTMGQPVIDNTYSPLNVTIKDSGAGGKIKVSNDDATTYSTRATSGEEVVAISSDQGGLTVNNQIVIEATSNSSNVTAIRFGAPATSYSMTLSEYVTVKANAANGDAVGIDVLGTSSVKPAAINATGKNAVAIRTNDGTKLTLTASIMSADISGSETAIGIYVAEGATLINSTKNANAINVVSQGDAYAICNDGTVTSINLVMTSNAENIAYGLYNNAGTVTVTGIGTSTDLRATGTEGYGLYNVANGTAIGAEDGDKLSSGAFAGSSYGLYSEDNSIYAKGNKNLYFKGADEQTALSGVVHKYQEESYEKTNAEEGYVNGADYFRLAAEYTITFVTNGGTEIASITKFYNVPLETVESTKRGYTFNSWHTTESLDSAYTYPDIMPDEDITLYAKWDLNQYQYALDTDLCELVVNFYRNQSSSDNTLLKTVELTKDHRYLTETDLPTDQTSSRNSYYVYMHTGWYTGRSSSAGVYVPMNEEFDLSQYISGYDENGRGIVNLYAVYNRNFSSSYLLDTYNTWSKLGRDPNPSTITVSGKNNSYLYYMYYVVEADGDYTLNISNTGSYSMVYYTSTYTPSSTTTYKTMSGATTLSAKTSKTVTFTNMKKGDAIGLSFRKASSSGSNTTMKCYVSTTADLSVSMTSHPQIGYTVVPITYNVEMGENGIVTLPIADSKGHEGMKFAGWAESAESERIVQITPDMVDTVPQWQNGELWQLYSQWSERTWDAYQSGERNFTAFENTAQVNIRGNGTVSVRFKTEQQPSEPLTFKFANGLPAGTILTLIDHSGAAPVYYTYTTKALTKELSSTAFVKMGAATHSFSGIGTDVVLQICYQNATVTNTSETVGIYAGDIVSEVDAVYAITPTYSVTLPYAEIKEFTYNEEHMLNVEIDPSAASQFNLPQDYKVFLRVRWDGVNLAPGSRITLGGMNVPIYDGEYAMLDLNMTVEQLLATTISTDININLPTMVQNEFENKKFYYELCIAPNTDVAFGAQVEPVIIITEDLTLKETPSLTVDAVEKTVPVGESVSVTVNDANAEFYLLQQKNDGKFERTTNCETVFESLTVGENGKLSVLDGALVNEDTFTATISANAVRGKYYLVVKLGDKYERILLKLVANTTE